MVLRLYRRLRRGLAHAMAEEIAERQAGLPEPPAPAPAGADPPRAGRDRAGWVYLGDHVGLALTHAGHMIYLDTRDRGIVPHLAVSGEWERAVEAVVLALLRPGAQIVEVGCNFGYFTLAMAEAIGPSGSLHGFEANPEVARMLRRSVELNGLSERVRLHEAAAADVSGRLVFEWNSHEVGGGHVALGTGGDYERSLEVSAVRLDEAVPTTIPIDLMRFDAEGSEGKILIGGSGQIERSPHLRIVTEWSGEMLRARGTEPAGLADWLVARGFKAWLIEANATVRPLAPSALGALPHGDVVLCRDDLVEQGALRLGAVATSPG